MERRDKTKILFLMPSMVAGGAERVLLNLFRLMDHDKYDVNLVTIEKKGTLWNEVPVSVNKQHLFPHPLLAKIAINLFRKFQNDWLFKFFGNKITGKYDVAVSFLDSIYTEFLFYNHAKISKIVAVIHSSYKTYDNKNRFIKGRYKQVIQERYSKVDTIISVSEEGLKQFKDLFGSYEDMRVIYNPIDRKDVKEKAMREKPHLLTEDKFNFVAVGNLLPVKGYDLLIEACSLLKEKREDFRIFVLGSGYLKNKLQRMIEEKNLSKHIFLKGFISNPYPWMSNADALLMASKAEGLPTVLCEAMILGVPVVVPDVPGCREVVKHGKYGIIYNRNKEEMVRSMEKVITDEKVKEHYKAQAKKRGNIFDDQKALRKYYDVFDGPVN